MFGVVGDTAMGGWRRGSCGSLTVFVVSPLFWAFGAPERREGSSALEGLFEFLFFIFFG